MCMCVRSNVQWIFAYANQSVPSVTSSDEERARNDKSHVDICYFYSFLMCLQLFVFILHFSFFLFCVSTIERDEYQQVLDFIRPTRAPTKNGLRVGTFTTICTWSTIDEEARRRKTMPGTHLKGYCMTPKVREKMPDSISLFRIDHRIHDLEWIFRSLIRVTQATIR